MTLTRALAAIALLFVTIPAAGDEPVPADHAQRMKQGMDLFREHVRQVFIDQCLKCHGGESVKADFDLSTRESLMASGMVGEDAGSSHLVALIRHEEEPHMPQKAARLPDETIAKIVQWIELGAPYDKPLVEVAAAQPVASGPTEAQRSYWSFQPLTAHAPPAVHDDWIRTDIDRFILARQQQEALRPNPLVDRRTLMRRACFDLTGLPPTPEELDSFVHDPDPQAYEKLIDRLLKSPRYGERWARHWMDIARFAESHGYEQDYDRPHAYHYRDFLIRALNDDMPYDQFVRWQLAGDELAPDDPLALMATGFLGAGAFPTQLTEVEFESARYDELDDMVSTLGTAVLGLSIGCARCHDHKFDPISSKEYYQLASVFTRTIRSEIPLNVTPAENAEPQTTTVQVTSEGFPPTKHHADDRGFPHFYPETHVLLRGDVRQKQEVAQPGYLNVLMPADTSSAHWQTSPPAGWQRTSFQRAGLARWITDVRAGGGSLAARVIVNRLWQHHFGRGIVATPSDFGSQGDLPTHPELLDWLATDLVHHGWKLKRLHKLIMTSSVYMQDDQYDEQRASIDRENRLLWRRAPQRLEAEAIRDSMLHVSGLLDETMFGPGTLDQNMRRRSVYFFIKRSKLIPMMMLFDWPEHLVGIGQRSSTTIAPQALMFMNSPEARQYAEGLADRVRTLSADEAVERAYRLALGRSATPAEIQTAAAFVAQQSERHATQHGTDASRQAWTDFCQALLSSNEFVYIP